MEKRRASDVKDTKRKISVGLIRIEPDFPDTIAFGLRRAFGSR